MLVELLWTGRNDKVNEQVFSKTIVVSVESSEEQRSAAQSFERARSSKNQPGSDSEPQLSEKAHSSSSFEDAELIIANDIASQTVSGRDKPHRKRRREYDDQEPIRQLQRLRVDEYDKTYVSSADYNHHHLPDMTPTTDQMQLSLTVERLQEAHFLSRRHHTRQLEEECNTVSAYYQQRNGQLGSAVLLARQRHSAPDSAHSN